LAAEDVQALSKVHPCSRWNQRAVELPKARPQPPCAGARDPLLFGAEFRIYLSRLPPRRPTKKQAFRGSGLALPPRAELRRRIDPIISFFLTDGLCSPVSSHSTLFPNSRLIRSRVSALDLCAADFPSTAQNLLRFPCVVLFAVDIGMVFQRLQVSHDFSGHL
jgi:hypothetical protein